MTCALRVLPNDRLVHHHAGRACMWCHTCVHCHPLQADARFVYARCWHLCAAHTLHARASFRTLRCTRIDFADADAEREALAAIEPLCKHVADNEPGTLS